MRPQYNVDRRSDLDVLLATMMLLVVVQFSAMPFFDSPWAIQDKERNLWYIIPFMMGNGFCYRQSSSSVASLPHVCYARMV